MTSPPTQIQSKTRREYVARINRVIDYIGANLDRPLGLEELAAVAAFSPFHFHRIFKAMVGESIAEFTSRLRLERAAGRLLNHPHASITEIALDCGFSSSSHFARAFKRHFGTSAGRYRETAPEKEWFPAAPAFDSNRNMKQSMRKNSIANGKHVKAVPSETGYNQAVFSTNPIQRRNNVMKIEVKQLPGWQVAYIRVMDGYKSAEIQPAFRRVVNWAQARELVEPDTVVLGVSLDNPDVTPADKCRYDACISVPPGTKPEGEVGIYDIPAGKYAVYRIEGTYANINAELGQAWNTLMGDWFPDSGYQPDDRPCFEIYRETEEQALSGKYIVDICEPVKPL